MPLDQLTPYLPTAAIAAGVLLVLWGQRNQLKSLVVGLKPAAGTEAVMSPAQRFETFYALRRWCAEAGHVEAIASLDAHVLPVIVCDTAEDMDDQGGPIS